MADNLTRKKSSKRRKKRQFYGNQHASTKILVLDTCSDTSLDLILNTSHKIDILWLGNTTQ